MPRLNEEELAEAMADSVNAMGFDNEKFAETLLKQHRTLQQSSFRSMLAAIKLWSEMADKGIYDARNEQTVKTSKKIMESLDNETYVTLI